MSTQVQIRKGNTIQTAAFTGAIAELTVDTDKKTLVVHDGVTAGGIPLARESALSANQVFSQAAFNAANSAATLSAATDLTQNNSIAAAFLAANTAATLSDATDVTQNNSIAAAFTQANTAILNAGNASIYANGAFLAANSAATLSAATDATQNTNITNAQNTADAAFLTANSAATLSAATDLTQNNSIAAAFTRANNSISANAGGTITGDLVVTGNLTISGQTTYANTISVQLGDNIITLNSETPTSLTPTENAGIEVNRGNTFANSSLLWIESSGKWQANSGSLTGAYFLADESVVTAAFLAANSAATLSAATDATQNNSITAAFNKANSALALTGGTIAGNVTANSVIANNSIYSPIYYSTGGLSNLILSDIGLVGISVAGQTYQFGGSGLESNQGIFGGSFGGNRLSLNNETNLISNRYDTVKIQTGTEGSVANEFVFANNSLTVPGGITANGFTAGGINVVPTLASSFSTANAAFLAANSAATLSAATDLTQNNSITAAFAQANTDVTNVSVAAGTYGNTTHYGVVTVAANGRVTSVSTFPVVDSSAIAFSIALG
jgi:hypothetical protein